MKGKKDQNPHTAGLHGCRRLKMLKLNQFCLFKQREIFQLNFLSNKDPPQKKLVQKVKDKGYFTFCYVS